MTHPPYLLVGNPEHRRVAEFSACLGEAGISYDCIAHTTLLRELLDTGDLPTLAAQPEQRRFVRLDSLGQNAEVERLLLHLGHREHGPGVVVSPKSIEAYDPAYGEVWAPRQQHRGLQRYFAALQEVLSRKPAWHWLNHPEDAQIFFDKTRLSRFYARRGIPVAPCLRAGRSIESLQNTMEAAGVSEVFVKQRGGSSASCLAIYRRRRGPDVCMTTLRGKEGRWFNSRKIQRLDDPTAIADTLGFLLGEGAHVEASLPKARWQGGMFDCRVLTVAGEPTFIVVRQSRHAITNLHLGGKRGDVAALRASMPAGVWESMLDTCRQVARLHRSLHIGIDVMFAPDFSTHTIIEANAFGDLLPGLTHEGRSVYAWEIDAAPSWVQQEQQAYVTVERLG